MTLRAIVARHVGKCHSTHIDLPPPLTDRPLLVEAVCPAPPPLASGPEPEPGQLLFAPGVVGRRPTTADAVLYLDLEAGSLTTLTTPYYIPWEPNSAQHTTAWHRRIPSDGVRRMCQGIQQFANVKLGAVQKCT